MTTHLLSDYDYELPPHMIAQQPARPRVSARLLDARSNALQNHHIADLPDILTAGDLLVVNNTKVIPAQLTGYKGASKIHFTLHQRINSSSWKAFARPAKKCKMDTEIRFDDAFTATIVGTGQNGEVTLSFSETGTKLDRLIDHYGVMPLPPYIKRVEGTRTEDKTDYQTIFACHEGAVAAPTAGLHFTHDLKAQLADKHIDICEITLHVGAGTFLPVKTHNIRDHKMHSEWGEVCETTIDKIKQVKSMGGRVICVGTTSLRILETAFSYHGDIKAFCGETDLFITPGFRFGVVDELLTNFHLPRSTLLMLVSAFAGHDCIFSAYRHAVEAGYRFFSYGDACLLRCTAKL